MSLTFHSVLQFLTRIMAAAAMLAFLLHGMAAAAPGGHHVARGAMSFGTDGHLGSQAADHDSDLARADSACCGIACSITLLPLAVEMAMDWSRADDEAALLHGKSGIEPDGIRRPPKTAA